jgi:hypothetical protein
VLGEVALRLRRWLNPLWALVLALLMLGPALGRGYVLSYDMVWVPDLALRPDFLGVGSGLPRAVPSDAVVAIVDELIPGMLLQKLVLVGMLFLGGLGVTRLVDRGSMTAGLVATSVYQWNPFVAERLVLGHWPVLVGYAAAPWVVHAARTWRETGRMPRRLWWLVPLGSLSASAGVATAVCLLAFLVSGSLRRVGAALALVAAGNAPWLVSGLLHAGSAATDAGGAAAFALHGEGSVPGPLAMLSLGGVWNNEVVPSSREGVAGWMAAVLVAGMLVLGMRLWHETTARRDVLGYLICAAVGVGVAMLGLASPAGAAWVFAHVPGTGLFRDGSRLLGLAALGLAVLAGSLAGRAARRLPEGSRPAGVLALVLLPVALLPDASFGVSGRLVAVDFPADFSHARTLLAEASADSPGDVLVLPLTSYRQPAWNDSHKVLDPGGRYLTPDYVAADDLYVSGVRIAGEDHRVADAAAALASATPEARSTALARLGIAFVVTERGAPAPEVAGRSVHQGELLSVQRLEGVSPRAVPWSWKIAMVCAWSLFAGSFAAGLGSGLVRRSHRARSAGNRSHSV